MNILKALKLKGKLSSFVEENFEKYKSTVEFYKPVAEMFRPNEEFSLPFYAMVIHENIHISERFLEAMNFMNIDLANIAYIKNDFFTLSYTNVEAVYSVKFMRPMKVVEFVNFVEFLLDLPEDFAKEVESKSHMDTLDSLREYCNKNEQKEDFMMYLTLLMIVENQNKNDEYLQNGEYVEVIAGSSTLVWFEAFNLYFEEMLSSQDIEDVVELFMSIYSSTDFNFENIEVENVLTISEMMKDTSTYSPYNTNEEWFRKKVYEKDGEEYVKVYRGVNEFSRSEHEAMSWTVSKQVAEKFANRYSKIGGTSKVIEREQLVRDILFINNDRKEYEVLI